MTLSSTILIVIGSQTNSDDLVLWIWTPESSGLMFAEDCCGLTGAKSDAFSLSVANSVSFVFFKTPVISSSSERKMSFSPHSFVSLSKLV